MANNNKKAIVVLDDFFGDDKLTHDMSAREAWDCIKGLLKDQEPVERTCRKGINGFSIIWTCGACGSDLHPNNAKAKFCSNCGQAVKWE